MTTPPDTTPVSVPLQTPWVGLNADPESAHYIGVLEGTIAALCINEAKYRALLELLTGEGWEDTRIDFNGQALVDLAVSALVKQTGMSLATAKVLVLKRWNTRNQPAEAVIPQAVPVEVMATSELVPKSRPDMSERFKAWQKKQQDDAKAIEGEQDSS